ncbi:hypothetical protein Hanom_Chr12g01135931 [Helianthus anomalus]
MIVLMVSFLFIYLAVLPSSQLNSKRDIGNHLVRQQMEKVRLSQLTTEDFYFNCILLNLILKLKK